MSFAESSTEGDREDTVWWLLEGVSVDGNVSVRERSERHEATDGGKRHREADSSNTLVREGSRG